MHVEIFLAVMVLAVALLVAADFFRRASEGPHEHGDRPVHDTGSAGRGAFTPSQNAGAGRAPGSAGSAGGSAAVTVFEPARTGRPGAIRPGSAFNTSPRTGPHAGTAAPAGAGGTAPAKARSAAKGSWLVRTRLSLLAAASALAAAAATASVIRAADVIHGASYHSDVSSIRDGATASAILAGVAAVAALAVGGWAVVLLTRSVLRPLDQLRTEAVELAEVRLPDALRSGGRGPLAVRSLGLSSSDEIGQIARAFDQVQAEVLGVTSDEAGLRGKLGEMFVELSSRGQALVERQIRLIDELEQGEQDSGRLASLFKMDHIATRMRRYSQNLLVLAGRELPGEWDRPVALVDVIRAAVSQIEDYERVSLDAQPGISVAGPAVKDVVHLLAELTDNATSLSAAGTQVDISASALASGGVLVNVTDQGVGMHPEVMAEANRRLDSPPAMDFAVSRNMGLFVVGRLAVRHGIKVRLQPATVGGLTAQVWLPDAVASRPDDGGAGFDDADGGPARGAHAAARTGLPTGAGRDGGAGLERGPAGQDAMARSVWSAPVLEDVRPQPSPATGAYPATAAYPATDAPGRHAWPDTGLQPRFHPHPSAPAGSSAPGASSYFSQSPATASPSPAAASPVRTQPSSIPQRLVASPRPAPAQPAAGEPAPARSAAAQPPATADAAAAAADAAAAAADARERRLPIFDAVESDWFGNRRRQAGGDMAGGAAASEAMAAGAGRWTATADPGWDAAQAAARPVSSGTTAAGLPVRSPRANLVPGTLGAGPAGGPQPPDKPPIPRSASAVRDRLSGFQRGTSQGRAAAGQDGGDQAP
jgi:signal transduction histidine kinase